MVEVLLLVGERQEGETRRAVIACNDYLRMGPGRSLVKLCRLYRMEAATEPPTRRLPTLKGWSRGYGWVRRAAEYDARVEGEKSEEAARQLEQMRLRQMKVGVALQAKAAARLRSLRPSELKPRDALRYLRDGMEMERRGRQLPMGEVGRPEVPVEAKYLPEGEEEDGTGSEG